MWQTPPSPIDVIVSDRNQNQIGKPARSQQVIDLPREIACSENTSKETLSAMLAFHERSNPGAFDCDKRRDCLESFRNTGDAGISIEMNKPILPAASMRAPERAPRR